MSARLRTLLAMTLIVSWLFSAGCESDDSNNSNNPVDPNPEPETHEEFFGFWNCTPENEASYPFTALSFGEMESGTLSSTRSLSFFDWTATDSTLLLNLIDGIRSYNYSMADDTLDLWVGQGGHLRFGKVIAADTVWVEQNPYRLSLALPSEQSVKLVLYDETGRDVSTLYDQKLPMGQHFVYFQYPETYTNRIYAYDAYRGSDYHLRQYRLIANRPPVPQAAKQIADDNYSRDAYQDVEYQFATSQMYGDRFEGTQDEWRVLTIEERLDYLPGNFRRLLPDPFSTSFYWYVADFTYQFGYGWNDSVEDDSLTVEWDGSSESLTSYREMLGLE